MPHKTTPIPPIDLIERDFLDAIDRLEVGAPLNPTLAKRAKLGTLKVNVSAAAQEAGHSRTLIGHDGCKYPRVRARVIGLKVPVTEALTAENVIRRLREENEKKKKKLALRDTENVARDDQISSLDRVSLRKPARSCRSPAPKNE
ncbi:MAG: hypothetical protein NTX38_07650 [Methylobacter sp.]|nr:hypothetical protein [Methylobacter sp.]